MVAPKFEIIEGPLNVETIPDQTGNQRERNYRYEFLKNVAVSFISYDRSIQKKGSDSLWRFYSLQHMGDAMTGVVVGWNVSYSIQNYVATVGQFYASAHFDCIVTSTRSNGGVIPVTYAKSYSIPKYFHINDGN